MEEKKKFEALQYSYENAGQFRAIAAILGYSEEYRNGDITFSKGNETYTYPLNTLKLGNLGDNRESLLEQSKERIISFFDKEQASNNFQEYSQYLRENHNVAIIKWDDIKQRWSASFQSILPSLIIEESYLQTFLHTLRKAVNI